MERMYVRKSTFKQKLKHLFWRLFNRIENNGNCDFERNGEGLFLDNLLRSWTKASQKRIVFDIGSNVGNYTQMLLDKTGEAEFEIHLFEPTKECFSVLLKKFGDVDNVFLNQVGLSDESKKALIYYDKKQSGLTSLHKRNLSVYGSSMDMEEGINLLKGSVYIEENHISHIDFIKIDIEGHELAAFQGLGKYLNAEFVDFIQFEYGGANLDSRTNLMEMYDFLNKRDFKIAKVMPKGLEIREYRPYMENFNYANYVAVSKKILD